MESTSSDATGVECSPGSELRPGESAVVSTYFGDLFFVSLDTPVGSNIVSVDEALFSLF